VPQIYERAFVEFETEVNFTQRCILCGEFFSGALTGTLSCAYHPFLYVNTATQPFGYGVSHDPPTNCVQCAELHLAPAERCGLVRKDLRFGCTAIDHCTDVHELLRRPYIAVPAIFWSMFAISKRDEYADFDALATNTNPRNGVVVIHTPEQLLKTLVVDIPGTQKEVRVPIAEIYEKMASRFNIQALADEIYAARAVNPESSISRMVQFSHKEASRRDALRRLFRKKAHFAPFIILARVMQCEGNGFRIV
jgi:hypothetical protein